jgi:hypothetical protein
LIWYIFTVALCKLHIHVPFNFPKKSFYKVNHQVMGREHIYSSVDVIIIIMGMKCHITPNATGKPPTHLLNFSPNWKLEDTLSNYFAHVFICRIYVFSSHYLMKRLKFERQKLAHISFSKQGEINQLLDMIYFHCCIV